MRIAFISNFFNHHQRFLSDSLARNSCVPFYFLETSKMSDERVKIGYTINEVPSYVKRADLSENSIEQTQNIITQSDAVIFGSASDNYLKLCKKSKKLIFIYSERIYKKGFQLYKLPIRIVRLWKKYSQYKKQYLLCASAYTYADFSKTFTFINKAYKWGYFPETKKYDVDTLLSKKEKNRILWCGRFIDWKHPDDVIKVAERLKSDGYDFNIDLIGTGEMQDVLNEEIHAKGLENNVHILGPMKPQQVREHMEQAGIYLFTSDFGEGWGAVLNESMNSGCAVVASHAIGSVPYLMKHNENGLIYINGDIDDLYVKVRSLLDNQDEQMRLGKNAYHTIADLWNAQVAAKRFLKLAEEIEDHGYCDLYEDGPCSRAEIINNSWFRG